LTSDLTHRPLDSLVHAQILRTIIDRGFAPSAGELSSALHSSHTNVEASLRRLDANHGIVLHPSSSEVWIAHPFSTTPTLFWVVGRGRGWWAPCAWCALGIATLVGEPVVIRSNFGGDGEPFELRCEQGRMTPESYFVHFPVPIARAWENVHRHCACTLVFRDRESIDDWSRRHGIPRGEVQPITKVAELARAWYGRHLATDWRKITAAEAADIFRRVGLTSEHWRVSDGSQRF
jgi:hypothetical protein